jgi:DNA-binding NtrC family response regulator
MNFPTQPRVLCVDDEPGVLRALEALLRERFDVSCTTDAREALERVRHSAFDVVISDQRMPGMTGTEFLEQVKHLSPRTMRLLLTGYADRAEALESVNDSEVFRFVHKPWDNRQLMKTVTYAATVARRVPLRPAAHPVDTGAGAMAGPIHWRGRDTRTVLLMDRDPATEHQLRTVLGQGTLLLWARNPGEAVGLMRRHKVAVVVLDSRSDTGATLDLIRAVKRNSPNVVVVIHAADGDSTTVSRLINEGQIFRFLAKPATPARIEHTLQAALQKHRELMAQPSSIARHAIDIDRPAAFARTDAGACRGTPAPGLVTSLAAPILSRPPLSGMAWLKRIFGKI